MALLAHTVDDEKRTSKESLMREARLTKASACLFDLLCFEEDKAKLKKGLQSEMKELRSFLGKADADALLDKTLLARVHQVLTGP